jgi:hypothetical protein
MKLKKRAKRVLRILLLIIVIGLTLVYLFFYDTKKVKKVKVLDTIPEYGYELNDNKSEEYKKLFRELEKILKEDKVDEDKYVETISKMFIFDFYSLNDKLAKTDVGGSGFVHKDARKDFLENAEDTLYKYVESNLYGNRNQDLPQVKEVKVKNVEKKPFTYGSEVDEDAYTVEVNWEYKDSSGSGYQDSATMVFVHEDKKLSLVELK